MVASSRHTCVAGTRAKLAGPRPDQAPPGAHLDSGAHPSCGPYKRSNPREAAQFALTSHTFISLGVPEDLVAVLQKQGIEEPFPIQAATLKDALAGSDVSGRAPTGSGKTLAFGLAMVVTTPKAQPGRPTALVLVP